MAKELGFKQGLYDEAVAYFRQKINLPTKKWNDIEGAMHTRAFTVAGAMRADILLDFRNAVDKAISNGDSLQDFRDNFYDIAKKWRAADPSFDAKMKKPKYGAWRSKVIYQTNMLTAAAAGQERQARAMPDVFTHAKYVCMMLPGSREEHKQWNGTVLPVNDPWWEKHSPPNGFGCMCEKEFISKYEMDAGLEKATKAPTPADDTTNIGEKWDYSIGDADAENQRLKEYTQEKEEKLFEKYPDARKVEKVEEPNKTANEDDRHSAIIDQANNRHKERTADEAKKIREKWALRKDERSYDEEHRQLFKDIEKKLGIKRGLSKSHLDANSGQENPNFIANYRYYRNCQTCTVVYQLRRWGFDIEAKDLKDFHLTKVPWMERFLNKDGSVIDLSKASNVWSNNFKSNIKTSNLKSFFKSKTSKNGVYEIYCQWKNGGAHVFNAIKENGVLVMHDPQSGLAIYPDDYISSMKPSKVYILRTDDKIVNTKMLGAFLVK